MVLKKKKANPEEDEEEEILVTTKNTRDDQTTIRTREGAGMNNRFVLVLLFVVEVEFDDADRNFLKRLAAHARAPPCKNRTSLSPANGPMA